MVIGQHCHPERPQGVKNPVIVLYYIVITVSTFSVIPAFVPGFLYNTIKLIF